MTSYPGTGGNAPYRDLLTATSRADRAPRADPVAALLLVVAGIFGAVQLMVPWIGIGSGLDGSYTGWDLFKVGRDQSLDFSGRVATYALPAVAIAGGALVLLGLAMFAPINHRPLGAVALAFSIGAVVGAAWWVMETGTARGGVGQIIDIAQPGWYLFLAAGPIGLIGSVKALATG